LSQNRPQEQKNLMQTKGMLLVLPVPFRKQGNQLLVESQACNGLEQWADNFESVVVAAPVIPESLAEQNKTMTWQDSTTLTDVNRFQLVPLPWAYSIPDFLSCNCSVRASLARLISRCHYLQFAIGGLFGDWAAVAALEAHQQDRAYAVHTDRVEHEVLWQTTKGARLRKRLKARVIAPLMANYHKWIIQNCALGLWHGNDCYAAYSRFCQNSYLIHNIHLKPKDRISALELAQKSQQAKSEPTIRICYAGRMEPMKGPLDWVKAIGRARELGVNLHATWMGDGSLIEEMRTMIDQLGLNAAIELSGFEPNRDKLLQSIREAHIMLFTHVTPESPRCLIESLACGTPIVGYHSLYAEELVKDFGGGMFLPRHDWKQLGELLVTLSQERQRLSQLIEASGKNGSRFDDEAVFHQRSELIKKHLTLVTSRECI